MKIQFDISQGGRRRLADEIGNALGVIPRYMRVPTCAYQIGDCVLDRYGVLDMPDTADADALIEKLRQSGYSGEREEDKSVLSVSVPLDGFTEGDIANLKAIIVNKAEFIKRAFQTDNTAVEISDGTIAFPWFPFEAEPEEVRAYMEFVTRLCEFAKSIKRVREKATVTDNDKYTFRCFLLRLGFIGSEYRTARRVLLKNLQGNSAFR